MSRIIRNALAWVALLGSGGLHAQSAETHRCASIAAPVERLACYDAAFGAPKVDVAVENKRAVEEFGLSETEKRERDPMAAQAAPQPDRIEALASSSRWRKRPGRSCRWAPGSCERPADRPRNGRLICAWR